MNEVKCATIGVDITWDCTHVTTDCYCLESMPLLSQIRRDFYQGWKSLESTAMPDDISDAWLSALGWTPKAIELISHKFIVSNDRWFLQSEVQNTNRLLQIERRKWEALHPGEDSSMFAGYTDDSQGCTTLNLKTLPSFAVLWVQSPIRQFELQCEGRTILHGAIDRVSSTGRLWPPLLLCFEDGQTPYIEVYDGEQKLETEQGFVLESILPICCNTSKSSVR